MASELSVYSGCLLGLAVGDAMGLSVDRKNYEEICRDYGPNGLLGYDLMNGTAEVSSYTQIAAFACNGLLLGITHEPNGDGARSLIKYLALAMREWAQSQRLTRFPGKMGCWVCHAQPLRGRRCLDIRTLDILARDALGTMVRPANTLDTPGSLTAAVSVGLFFHPDRMQIHELGTMGAQVVALSHGDPATFLSGAVLAYIIAGIAQDRETALREHFLLAAQAVEAQFGRRFPQTAQLRRLVEQVIAMAEDTHAEPRSGMAKLICDTAPRVLAGSIYAALVSEGDFDRAMVAAVNHSGRSAAVGALTGAILGAYLGEEALPEFYLESLTAAGVLRQLAQDLARSCPKGWSPRLFDDDWDRKYIQGEPVEH